jgi:hypothetical protein
MTDDMLMWAKDQREVWTRSLKAQSEGLWARLAHMGDAQEDLEEKFDSREPCR